MKRKDLWKELNIKPQKKPSRTASPLATPAPAQQEAAQQALRSNCVRTLLSALSVASDQPEGQQSAGSNVDPGDAQGAAEAIEHELFRLHQLVAGQRAEGYKAAARTLVASLKRNADLRLRVLIGEVRPMQLVGMDSRQLATQQQREEYDRLQKQETRRVMLAGDGSGSLVSSDYMCGRCGGRSCSYLDSGRRDSGKCETWGSKDGQGSSRLVTCQGCGQRWEVDDV